MEDLVRILRESQPIKVFVEAFSKRLDGEEVSVLRDQFTETTKGDEYTRVLRSILLRAKYMRDDRINFCEINQSYEISQDGSIRPIEDQ